VGWRTCCERGYYLLVDALQPNGRGQSFAPLFFERRIDAAVVHLSGPPAERAAYAGELGETGCPFVLIEESSAYPFGAAVRADNREGAFRAVEYLLQKGHSEIAFLTGATAWPALEERLAGYIQALQAHDRPVYDDRVVAASWSHAEGEAAARALLERLPRRSAVLCANDLYAVRTMAAARSLGRASPDDVAVIGFDDFEFAAFVDPPLTTVALPGYEMGRRAAELLLAYLHEGEFPEKEVVFPATLTVRDSA